MSQDVTTAASAGETDLAGVVSRFRRHVPISLAIIAAIMLLAGVLTQFMPRKFTATTDLAFAPQASLIKGNVEPNLTDAQRDAAIEAQLQIATSLEVARDVLAKGNLSSDPELREAASSFSSKENHDDAMAAALLRNLSARRVGQTSLFRLSYTAADPLAATRIVNLFSDAYLANQVKQKVAQTSAASGQLDARVDLLRQQAEAADAQVAAFRVANNLTNNPDSVAQEQEISVISTQLSEARGQAALVMSRSAVSGNTIVGGGPGGAIDTSTMSRLQDQRTTAASDLAALQTRYGDRHPQVIAARDRLAAVDTQITSERNQLIRASQAEANAALARASSLAGSLATAQARQAGNVRAGVQLAELSRKAESARLLYQNLLATRGEQTAQTALVQPDARQVAPASPPLRPSSPNLLINLVIGFALGVAIALTVAYLRERWTQTLNTIDDIERHLGVPFLNSIPTLQSAITSPKTQDPVEAVPMHPMSALAEAYRNLGATAMFTAKSGPGGRVIGIGSALPREGKTTTSISLARVIAMGGVKVALVDADLRRRSTTIALNPDVAQGWTDVGTDAESIKAIALEDSTGMTLIPSGPEAHKTQQAFAVTKFDDLIATLRTMYDVVVVDTAPVLAVVDTRTMLHNFDNFMLLAAWRQTPIKAIRAAIHQVQSVGGQVDGVAMTMVNLKTQAQSGYGDASYYYRDMKEYYVNE